MRPQDELLVDIILFLCRAMLDALQLTNRRLQALVQKRAKGVCLRPLEVAELYADGTYGPPHFVTRLVTPPTRQRDGGPQRESLALEDVPPEEMTHWFVKRLRHSVTADKLTYAVATDAPDLVESIERTVLVEKGLRWIVRQAIDVDNAFKFLSSFTGLRDVELWCYERSFRLTDDWFKLFEAIYRVTLYKSACAASMKMLVSFLFDVSCAPGSENRILITPVETEDWKTPKAAAEQLIEAAVCCTSTHKSTLLVKYRIHTDPMLVLAKYKNDLRHYSAGDVYSTRHDEGQDDDGYVLNIRKDRFRIQVFCYSGGLQIRRARSEEVGFFPAWLETATAQ